MRDVDLRAVNYDCCVCASFLIRRYTQTAQCIRTALGYMHLCVLSKSHTHSSYMPHKHVQIATLYFMCLCAMKKE
jgi:hypothetical protein